MDTQETSIRPDMSKLCLASCEFGDPLVLPTVFAYIYLFVLLWSLFLSWLWPPDQTWAPSLFWAHIIRLSNIWAHSHTHTTITFNAILSSFNESWWSSCLSCLLNGPDPRRHEEPHDILFIRHISLTRTLQFSLPLYFSISNRIR